MPEYIVVTGPLPPDVAHYGRRRPPEAVWAEWGLDEDRFEAAAWRCEDSLRARAEVAALIARVDRGDLPWPRSETVVFEPERPDPDPEPEPAIGLGTMQTLECRSGHLWVWKTRKGRKPVWCPAHRSDLRPNHLRGGAQTLWCNRGHEWQREPVRGRKPYCCPEHYRSTGTLDAKAPSSQYGG